SEQPAIAHRGYLMSEFSDFITGLRSRVGAVEFESPEDDAASSNPLRLAVVALVLREGLEGPELLVIKRSEAEHDHWSGHMALPGGRVEPEDESLLATAARETFEEVGLDPRAG